MSAVTSRVFMNGNSQAARIPAQFRLETDRVRVARNEAGDLVSTPCGQTVELRCWRPCRALTKTSSPPWRPGNATKCPSRKGTRREFPELHAGYQHPELSHPRNQPAATAARINALPEGAGLCMSFITYAELLKGAERRTRKPQMLARLQALSAQVAVRDVSAPAICRHYAAQSTRLTDAGTPIGAHSLWIACHALAEGATLVTHTIREFQPVGGLRVEHWMV